MITTYMNIMYHTTTTPPQQTLSGNAECTSQDNKKHIYFQPSAGCIGCLISIFTRLVSVCGIHLAMVSWDSRQQDQYVCFRHCVERNCMKSCNQLTFRLHTSFWMLEGTCGIYHRIYISFTEMHTGQLSHPHLVVSTSSSEIEASSPTVASSTCATVTVVLQFGMWQRCSSSSTQDSAISTFKYDENSLHRIDG